MRIVLLGVLAIGCHGSVRDGNLRTDHAAVSRIAGGVAAGAAAQPQPVYTQQPAPTYTPQARREQPRACSGDHSCPWGWTCVKANFSSSGTCAQSVNQYGTPTYEPPRSNSYGPKMPSPSDCKYDTQCPVGFRCHVASGSCLRQ